MSKVAVHSPDMISVDCENFKCDAESRAYIRTTKLFRTLVRLVGKRHADHIILQKAVKSCKRCRK